jgi:hypothetical protein
MKLIRTLGIFSATLLIGILLATPAKADWWNDLFNPVREIADPYFDNIWYASLYPQVKEEIDQNHSEGNRVHQYMRICNIIAENKGIRDKPTVWVPIYSDISEYIGQRAAIVVKDNDGTIDCYFRDIQSPN